MPAFFIARAPLTSALIANPLPAINDVMELDLLELFRTVSDSGKSALLHMARMLQGEI